MFLFNFNKVCAINFSFVFSSEGKSEKIAIEPIVEKEDESKESCFLVNFDFRACLKFIKVYSRKVYIYFMLFLYY